MTLTVIVAVAFDHSAHRPLPAWRRPKPESSPDCRYGSMRNRGQVSLPTFYGWKL